MNDDDRYFWKDRQRQRQRDRDDFEAMRALLWWGFLLPATAAATLWLVSVLMR